MEFSAQATFVPPWVILIDLTVASDEPTLKVPGLVTVKVPESNVQLSAVEVSIISISAVPAPKVTAETVIFESAVKSLVAAKIGETVNNATIIQVIIFFI